MNSADFLTILLYEFKLNNNAAKALQNINQAFGENTITDRKSLVEMKPRLSSRKLDIRMKVDYSTILQHLPANACYTMELLRCTCSRA
ncbi:hypothetical protein ANTPLA_LOCUS5259 [Anthophora plagiata]